MALLTGGLLGVVALLCAVWVIYDVFTQNKKLSTELKVLWTVLALIFNIITAIIYFLVYKLKK